MPGRQIRGAVIRMLLAAGCACLAADAQSQFFAGALGGVSTLSADGRSQITAGAATTSTYKPENGGILNIFAGVHLTDYFSLQANFTAHRNNLTLNSVGTPDAVYEEKRNSSRVAFAGDALLYFRNRRSAIRPYLSAGGGVARFRSELQSVTAQRGTVGVPPREFSAVKPVLRVAVGIDVRIRDGWAVRYSFAEAIQGNPISAQLSPPGQRNLAVFQNLFGFSKTFGKGSD